MSGAEGAAAPGAPAGGETLGTLLGGAPAGGTVQAGAPDTRAWLPEAYRADPMFADLHDLDGLAKSYQHATRLIGADRAQVLRIPSDPAAAEWNDVYQRLGRPDTADGYELTAPDGIDADTLTGFKAMLHKQGLSKTQATEVMAFYGTSLTGLQARQEAAGQAAHQDVTNALKREWGNTFDDQLHAARRAVREVGGDDMLKLLEDTRLGDHPAVIRMFAKIGAGRAEPAGLRSGESGGPAGLTPASAKAEIQQLQGDAAFGKSLSDRQNPGYAAARQRWDALHAAAYPAEPK